MLSEYYKSLICRRQTVDTLATEMFGLLSFVRKFVFHITILLLVVQCLTCRVVSTETAF